MKLTTIQVENYRCIVDTTEFTIAPVTCLVGKNEAGKTAILQALHKISPVYEEDGSFNDVLEYPRRNWSEYSQKRRETKPDNVVTTKWVLEGNELLEVNEKLGAGALASPEFTVMKGLFQLSGVGSANR